MCFLQQMGHCNLIGTNVSYVQAISFYFWSSQVMPIIAQQLQCCFQAYQQPNFSEKWAVCGAVFPLVACTHKFTASTWAMEQMNVNCHVNQYFVAQTSTNPMGSFHWLLTSSTQCVLLLYLDKCPTYLNLFHSPPKKVVWPCWNKSPWVIITFITYHLSDSAQGSPIHCLYVTAFPKSLSCINSSITCPGTCFGQNLLHLLIKDYP